MDHSNFINSPWVPVFSESQFLESWDWEWFCTFTFDGNEIHSPDRAKKYLLRWTRKLCTREHMQLAYFYSLSYKGNLPHLHLLMLGRGHVNGENKSLLDVSPNKWVREWPFFAQIQWPRSNEAVSRYLAKHQLWFKSDHSIIDAYNLKLLKKLRISS